MISVLIFLAGLGLLVLGAEMVVRGASCIAVLYRVTPMLIGLTIVSIGTSTPELAIGIVSAVQGKGGLAVGNIAGTNVLNLLFILGMSALIRPLPLHVQVFKLELPAMVLAATLMAVLAWDGTLSALDGVIMFIGGGLYTAALIYVTRRATPLAKEEFREEYGPATVPAKLTPGKAKLRYGAILIAGLVLTVTGAELLVRGAVDIARAMKVSETVIGLTIVAVGTSAPELVTTIISTIKNDRDVAVGNILGSSIYNILFILGIPCVVSIKGVPVEAELLWCDIPLMAAVALGAIPIFLSGRQISRLEGGAAVLIYIGYLSWLVMTRA